MRPTASSTTKKTAPVFRRPQTARKTKPEKKSKETIKPKTPEAPWPDIRKEKDLGFKSAPRAKNEREKKSRRRTRVVASKQRTLSCDVDFEDFIEVVDVEKAWSKLSKSDRHHVRNQKMEDEIQSLMTELEDLHLPNEELSEALLDLERNYKGVKFESYAHYWRLRVLSAIRCGKKESSVYKIIGSARLAEAKPEHVIDEIWQSTFEMYKKNPGPGYNISVRVSYTVHVPLCSFFRRSKKCQHLERCQHNRYQHMRTWTVLEKTSVQNCTLKPFIFNPEKNSEKAKGCLTQR